MAPVDPAAGLAANTDQAARAPGTPRATQGADPAEPVDSQSSPAQASQQQPSQNESQQRADEYRRTGRQEGAPSETQQGAPDQNMSQDQALPPPNQSPDQGYPQDMNQGAQPTDDQVDAGQEALEADQAPPPLPDYDQPEAPAPNYIWTPGYWDYNPAGYYWVPGAWVMAPYPGALWTPGYWIFIGGHHWRWHHGWWGPHIGFYGGINYGCGYTGYGYHGGYWNGNTFFYNRSVNRVNIRRITNVYNQTVVVNNVARVSYNSGPGGIAVRPRPAELAAMREVRTPAMTAQIENRHLAAQDRAQFYSENRGRPGVAAVARPLPADRGITRPMPGAIQPQVRYPSPAGQFREPAQQNHLGQPQTQFPARPEQQQVRPGSPQVQPVRPEVRPGQPGAQQVQPARPSPYVQPTQPQVRPQSPATHPNYTPGAPAVHPVQPQPQPQIRHAPEQQIRPVPEHSYRPQAEQPPFRPQTVTPVEPRPTAEPRPRVQPVPQFGPQTITPVEQHPRPSAPVYRPNTTQPSPQPHQYVSPQQGRQDSQPHGGGDHPHR